MKVQIFRGEAPKKFTLLNRIRRAQLVEGLLDRFELDWSSEKHLQRKQLQKNACRTFLISEESVKIVQKNV